MEIPRREHPNPQMERDEWMNLNGKWEFTKDPGRSGRDRKLYEAGTFDGALLPGEPALRHRGEGFHERGVVPAAGDAS